MTDRARGWGFLPLLLVPLVCCALPLAVSAGVALGAMVLGGTVAGAVVFGIGIGIVFVRRRGHVRDDASSDAESASRAGR